MAYPNTNPSNIPINTNTTIPVYPTLSYPINNETNEEQENNILNDEGGICSIFCRSLCNTTTTTNNYTTNNNTVSSSNNILVKLGYILLRHFYLVSLLIILCISLIFPYDNTYGVSLYTKYLYIKNNPQYDNTTTITNNQGNTTTSDNLYKSSEQLSHTIITSWTIIYSKEICLFFISLSFFIQGILYAWSISTLHSTSSLSTGLEKLPSWKFNIFSTDIQAKLVQYLNDKEPTINSVPPSNTNSTSQPTIQVNTTTTTTTTFANPMWNRSLLSTSLPSNILSPLKSQEKKLFFTVPQPSSTIITLPNNGTSKLTLNQSSVTPAPPSQQSSLSNTNSSSSIPNINDSVRPPQYVYIPPYRHPTTGLVIPGGWIEIAVVQQTLAQQKSVLYYICYPLSWLYNWFILVSSNWTNHLSQSKNICYQLFYYLCIPCTKFYQYSKTQPFLMFQYSYYLVYYLGGPYIIISIFAVYFNTIQITDYITPLCCTLGLASLFMVPFIAAEGDGVQYTIRHIITNYNTYTVQQRINKLKSSLTYFTLFSYLAPSIFQSSWKLFDYLYPCSLTTNSCDLTANQLALDTTTGILVAVTLVPFWIPIFISSIYRLSGISTIPFCLRFESSYFTLILVHHLSICIAIVILLSAYPITTFWLRDGTQLFYTSFQSLPTSTSLFFSDVLQHPIIGIIVGILIIFSILIGLPLLGFFMYIQ